MLGNINATPTIGVKDLNSARKFYEEKLGLKPSGRTDDEDVQLYEAGNGTLEVYKSEFAGTNKATALTWTVGDNLEQEVKALKEKGVTFEHYDMPDSRLEGDIHVMGDMKAAWFKDPDGNILCMHDH